MFVSRWFLLILGFSYLLQPCTALSLDFQNSYQDLAQDIAQ
jgi:hypothetical protein